MRSPPQLLPDIASGAEMFAAIGDASLWPGAIEAICERHGLVRDPFRRAKTGTFAVFFLGDAHVVKLVPNRSRPQYEAEVAMTSALHGVLPVTTPELVASGDLDGWGYLVTRRIEGRGIGEVLESVSPDVQEALLEEVGALTAAIHAVPTRGLERLRLDWPAFIDMQIRTCIERHARAGTPDTWTREMPAFLGGVRALVASPAATVPMTSDLSHEAVLVGERDGRWRVTGLVDFGDSIVGDPAYDAVSPAVFLIRGRRALLHAFARGQGVRTEEQLVRWKAYTLLHRFSTLARDVANVAQPTSCTNLDEALSAIWPG